MWFFIFRDLYPVLPCLIKEHLSPVAYHYTSDPGEPTF
jgi:hypothetical protein